jgi:ubiquinone/menaquinone biosynthesis C-methylase UbiE
MKNMWDDRYDKIEFAYGEQPNNFLKEELIKIPVGTILFPAEGEGRNAIYAAKLGWNVAAFDQSIQGKKKAEKLANKHDVAISYEVGEFQSIAYQENQFDAIALIYAHFPADKKSSYHKVLTTYLRPGGTIIFEAFSKKHLDYNSKNEKIGEPKDLDTLFSIDELKSDFQNFEVIELEEKEIQLNEGQFHNGLGMVIRFVGRKKTAEQG